MYMVNYANMKDVMHPYPSQTSRQIQFFLGHLVLSHVTCHGSGSMFESRHGVFSRPLRRKLSRIHSMPWDAFGAATFELPTGSTGNVLSTFTNPFLDMFAIFTAHLLDQRTQKNVARYQAWLFLMGKMGRSPLPDSLLEGKPSSGTHGPFKFAVFQLALANKFITNERV